MIWFWLVAFLLLLSPVWVFVPLFLIARLIFARFWQRFLAIVFFGTLFDLVWVWPWGSGIIIYSLFLLIVALYNRRYSFYNQFFLLLVLVGYSACLLWVTHQNVSFKIAGVFIALFILLTRQLKKIRQEHYVNL